jgi:hypothetical protein
VDCGVPRINQEILDCVIYLYPDIEAAKNGENCGGTGFLVSTVRDPYLDKAWPHVYAVTNRHNIVKGRGCPVVRMRDRNEQVRYFEFEVSDWEFIPNGNDVAAAYIHPLDDVEAFSCVPVYKFANQSDMEFIGFAPGEDVFMVGRFIDHDGGITNMPAVRFGNLSVMAAPVFLDFDKKKHECLCVDMHSRTGFSGSPVFAYRVFGHDLEGENIERLLDAVASRNSFQWRTALRMSTYFGLLGIHCGQFPEDWRIKDSDEYVEGMSGMTVVVPAWDILATIESPKVMERRVEVDRKMRGYGRWPKAPWQE